jgi:hypothetical protein
MNNQNSNYPQAAPALPESQPQPDQAHSTPPRVRPNRNFPMYFVQTPEGERLMDSVRYAEYQATLRAAEDAQTEARDRARAAREAELAAGRPPAPSAASSSIELSSESVNSTLAKYNSSLARSSATSHSVPPDSERHSRRCSICSHPDRDAIEGDFVRWGSPIKIAEEYGLADRSSIYRHVHATGLFARRAREVARTMEKYLELVDHHSPSEPGPFDLDAITRAVRVYSHLDHNGRWVEPIRTHCVLTGPIAQNGWSLDESSPAAQREPSEEESGTTFSASLQERPRRIRKKPQPEKTRPSRVPRPEPSNRNIPKLESEPNS